MRRGGRRARVLFSVRGPSPTTNPYVVQLGAALEEHVDLTYFTWRRGLLGRYDVLHVHWPEVMFRRVGRVARMAALVRFTLLMARLTVTGTPVVRTVHNPTPHDGTTAVERLLLAWCDRRTRFSVLLNPATPRPSRGGSAVIPHGHYVEWCRDRPRSEQVPGRVLCFGLFRPYKGVEHLLEVFGRTDLPDATLRMVGKPSSDELRTAVQEAVARDPRTAAVLAYVDEDELAREITAAQLVVLPYRAMHNSGAVLLALSLGRPVLVPRGDVTVALADEVGSEWVHLFTDELTPSDVEQALAATGDLTGEPDLVARDWPTAGKRHAEIYAAV